MRKYELTVRGKAKTWGFKIMAEPASVEAWRADGLDVDEIVGEIEDACNELVASCLAEEP